MEDRNYQNLLARIEELESQNRRLSETVEKLSIDPSYEILTRQALELALSDVSNRVKNIVFFDINYLHKFNSEVGHEEANRRIRRALKVRESDIVLKPGKYYSGDEVVILLPDGDPVDFCNRLQESFIAEGLSIMIAWVEFTGDFRGDVDRAKKIVFDAKAARGGDSR